MKNWMLVLAAALALTPAAIAADKAEKGHEHMHHEHAAAPAGATTLEGNIVDMACYMGHGDMDDKHGKCAKACVVRGTPAGLVTADGAVYLLLENHDSPKGYDAAKKLAGEKAKVTGSVVEKAGMKAVMVTGAEKAK